MSLPPPATTAAENTAAAAVSAESAAEGEPVDAWRGRLLVLMAALGWSTSGFFAKADTFQGWPGGLLAFWRSLFACAVIFPLVRRPAWSWWLVPMTVCFVLMIWTFLTAVVGGLAATAIWLQSTAPVWVLIVGVLFFEEKFHRRDLILVFFGLAGVAVILFFELREARAWAALCGFSSGLFYAAVVICLRRLRHLDAAWLAGINHGMTALCLAPYVFLVGGGFWPQGIQWAYLAAFGALQIGIPYVLFARGLREVSGHEAGGICLIEPVLVPIWTWLAWGEKVTPHVLMGGALIFLGLMWRYLGARTPPLATKEVQSRAAP